MKQIPINGCINRKQARGSQRYNYLDEFKTYTKLNLEEVVHFVKDKRK